MPRKMLLNFAVTGNGLRHFRGRILIPIVFSAVTNEDTAGFFNLSNQVAMFSRELKLRMMSSTGNFAGHQIPIQVSQVLF